MTDTTHPSRRAGLRDEIAAVIWERQNPGRRYADCEHPWQADAEEDANAVLALLYREWPWLRAEAEDAPVVVPAADRAALVEAAAQAIRDAACPGGDCPLTEAECAEQRIQPAAWERGVLSEVYGRPEWFAAAALSVLPAPADRAAVLTTADAYRFAADAVRATIAPADWPSDAISIWNAATNIAEHRLRRMAVESAAVDRVTAETPPAETQRCAHCGKPVRRITGTLSVWWVHDPGGRSFCEPWRPATSTRAEPGPVVPAQPGNDTETPTTAAPKVIRCAEAAWTSTPHPPHDWQQRPDAVPVRCPGTPPGTDTETPQPKEA